MHDVPLLRGRVDSILRRSGLDPHSHDGKALLAILEAYPRDELFQIDEDTLYDHALGILQLQERRRVALFARRDAVGRFATCLVFAPRERFDAALSDRFAAHPRAGVARQGDRRSTASVSSDSALAQALYTLKLDANDTPTPDLAELERALADAATSWSDRLRAALQATLGEAEGRAAARRWRDWFPAGLSRQLRRRRRPWPTSSLVQAALGGRPFGVRLDRAPGLPAHRFDAAPVPSQGAARAVRHPAAGREPRPARAERGAVPAASAGRRRRGAAGAERRDRRQVAGRSRRRRARASPRRSTSSGRGALENDGLNRLVLGAGLAWREVAILRAYAKYLRQAGIAFSQDYMERALVAYPAIARLAGRSVPGALRSGAGRGGVRRAQAQARADRSRDRRRAGRRGDPRRGPHPAPLPQRRALHACAPTTGSARTKDWISFKLDSRAIDELPVPRPLVEIFVYSPRMEGIHLRGGQVARGGIRWSDRREDFRTEILGLMKAQMVKNAVIVPVGSKGGFYVKRPPVGGTREQVQAEGIACYQTLIRGLLDITDNYVGGGVVPPADVVRHDGDDPYLVVAADKGTATFSDIANALAREYGFWLGDAFASGGSAGYDHKKMGITARGAWESVKRHFRELGTGHPDARPSPSSASATCRATCSATACCCRSTSSCWRPSTTATSSSIPSPIRRRAGPSASGCSTCRARPGPTTTRR